MNTIEQVKKDISEHGVLLYMKGERNAPECGFSAAVCRVLDQLGVAYETRNVLADPALREAVKQHSNWPTIPQLYINGEFIGGCDITLEMSKNGELQKLLEKVRG